MARFFYDDKLGQYGLVSNFVNGNALTVTAQTASSLTLKDAEGDGFTLKGSGLIYLGDAVVGGTITDLTIFNSTGGHLISADRFSISALALFTTFSLGGLEAALLQLTAGNDLFVGSGVGDILESGLGNDTVRGGAGADIIHGSKGSDVLTGGAGADHFVFLARDGTDRITDFQDAGLGSDDGITISARLYHAMVVTETLTGVELDFGLKGMLIVDGWHAVDVDRGDFFFA